MGEAAKIQRHCSILFLNSKSGADELEKLRTARKDQQDLTGLGISRNGPIFKVENKTIENPVLEDTSGKSLLGDTSVLDDLFKSHENSPTQLPKKGFFLDP